MSAEKWVFKKGLNALIHRYMVVNKSFNNLFSIT
jgi:hypothetical protein